MKIKKGDLRNLIIRVLNENENINIEMDVPNRQGIKFSVKASGKNIDAFFENEDGEVRKLSDNEEDKRLLLGVLAATLPTIDKNNKQKRGLLVKLFARLTDESEADEDIASMTAKIETDRMLAANAEYVKNKNTRLV